MDDILNRIITLLDKSGMKKIEFLNKLGLSRSAWSGWTSGRMKSYEKMLPQIAKIFGVSLDWLAGNEQKNRPAAESGEPDPLDTKIMELFSKLSPANKKLALAQIEVIVESQDSE